MGLAYWLNTAWMWKCSPAAWAFERMTRRVPATQADVLDKIVRRNRDTAFGRAHGFPHVRGPRDFQARVLLSTYESYTDAIRRIAAGEAGVLTRDRVLLLEPTGGSTGGEKLIPYTAGLRRQFQVAVAVWVANLFRHRLAVRQGRAYWSISPALGPRRCTPSGIPIGFDDDAAYLGTLEQRALGWLLAVPGAVARVADMEAFRYCTLLHLLAAEDLSFISIWNPTFLTALLAPLPAWIDRLCFDLRRGTLSPPGAGTLLADMRGRRPACPRRAEQLAAAFRSGVPLPASLAQSWPRLALISCWADASAARCVGELYDLFLNVEIQPKGLLATEGCVTIPLVGKPAPVLAVGSHFFEFQEAEGEPARCRLAHELDRGGRYRVVLTTAGGLYRYQLQDEVEVAGFHNECPLLRFLGKADRTSDLVGEKLSEPHVRRVLDRLFAARGLSPRFALLVPVLGCPARYRLYLQGPGLPADGLAADLQQGLEENPHYRYAVRLGQLGSAEVAVLDPQGESGSALYERQCLSRGQRAGNIKPTSLDGWTGWPEVFRCPETPFSNRRPAAPPPMPAGNP
jgi:hypothetical protein